ncbi:MAG: hypothetical protein L6R41_004596 [Letrouitia leprolyta]|nr:MAG: hypothetical protein L6R41_004596 [Letrouitia leprolyta]
MFQDKDTTVKDILPFPISESRKVYHNRTPNVPAVVELSDEAQESDEYNGEDSFLLRPLPWLGLIISTERGQLSDSDIDPEDTIGNWTAATTEKGYIAVASEKGDIRLFDELGLRAKTALPALDDPSISLDVAADGRWVLATCRTYLLLIDTMQKDGKNEGKLGFEKSFAKDGKRQPRRLKLKPSHVAQFQYETKVPLSFTPAQFNTGVDKETSIITATGPSVVTTQQDENTFGKKADFARGEE